MTVQPLGTVNETEPITSVPVPVSVTLTPARKATAVSSTVDTFELVASPALGLTSKSSATELVRVAGVPMESLSVSSEFRVIVTPLISPLKCCGGLMASVGGVAEVLVADDTDCPTDVMVVLTPSRITREPTGRPETVYQ